MKELKFRMWLGDHFVYSGSNLDENNQLDLFFCMAVPGVEIEQYIGLQDKNDKDIYDGDILRYYYGYEDIGFLYFLVKFGESEDVRWGFYIENCLSGSFVYVFNSLEIAGNSHENQELLR